MKLNNRIAKLVKKAAVIYYMAAFTFSKTYVVKAEGEASEGGGFKSSKLATGTVNLINDLSNWLLILVPSIGLTCALYFFIRKSAANEQEQHQWDKRLKITFGCIVGGTVASAMISTITGYYK
ncbi:hypothetical protein [Anaeromicropila populeti]|uniref:Uncharacterized protein n=1 Tax=Anaeromicropila populeti TaxID=37658 RepID=A0A1I6JFD9_9FIRM|nr:hypothetical protein [Anaeromicropila populeti]SFR77584.1 hypothetical protein SAMN05661086_01630 [Anaeromicropila populeti]